MGLNEWIAKVFDMSFLTFKINFFCEIHTSSKSKFVIYYLVNWWIFILKVYRTGVEYWINKGFTLDIGIVISEENWNFPFLLGYD